MSKTIGGDKTTDEHAFNNVIIGKRFESSQVIHWTLIMTSAQVIDTSVNITKNSLSPDNSHSYNSIRQTKDIIISVNHKVTVDL